MSGETVITTVGNLTDAPELRWTQNGKAVANFTIASTPRTFDRQSNEWKDGDALFLRASVWGEFAEHVAGSLVKGSRVIAQGRLRQRSYQDRDGQQRISIELEVEEIGPSLRYATAQVTRTQGGGRGGQPGAQYGQQVDHSAAGTAYQGEQPNQPWRPDQPVQGGGQAQDVWSQQPYDDETPF